MDKKQATYSSDGSEREMLLHQAIRQMLVVRNVIRRSVKQIRQENLFPDDARLGEGQFHALHNLCEDGAMTVGSLAEVCHVADPTISKMLKSLEHGGWIARRTDPENRRTVWVEVTPAGRELYARVQAVFEGMLASLLAPLTEQQLQDLITAFGHLEGLVAEDNT